VTVVSVLIVGDTAQPFRYLVGGGTGAVALVAWAFGVRSQWVRSAADLYAIRLLEATETLARTRSQ
jgi:hypothetical protein